MTPIVRHFFGIQPSASENKIVLKPCLPSKWNDAELKGVAVFDGEIDIAVRHTDKGTEIRVNNRTGRPMELVREKQWIGIDEKPCGEVFTAETFSVVL